MSKFIGNYYPSNGDEGMWFTDKFCMKCANCNPDPDGEKQCEILANTLFSDPLDCNEWEWVYDEQGNPTCKKHKPWNWETMGDPDDPNNSNYIQQPNPNQLELF